MMNEPETVFQLTIQRKIEQGNPTDTIILFFCADFLFNYGLTMGLPRGSLDPGVNALVGLKESVKDGVFFERQGDLNQDGVCLKMVSYKKYNENIGWNYSW